MIFVHIVKPFFLVLEATKVNNFLHPGTTKEEEIIKGVVHPKLILYPFATHHNIDGGTCDIFYTT